MTTAEKKSLKEKILDGELGEVFSYLTDYLASNEVLLLNDLLVLDGRYRRLKKDQLTGVTNYETQQISINKIMLELLYFVDQISEANQVGQPRKTQRRKGKVLHDIPTSLPLKKLTKCVIRIGETEELVLENFKASNNTVIEEVNIGQKMAVELFELGDGDNFEIQSANSSAQRVDSFEATEWKFYVRPLVEGMHLLFLRISIVQEVDGKELTKETVLEQEVSVTGGIPEMEVPRNWSATNVVVTEREAFVMTAPAPASPTRLAAPKKMKRALMTQLLLFGGLGIALAATTLIFYKPIFRALGIGSEVVQPTPEVGPPDTLKSSDLAPLEPAKNLSDSTAKQAKEDQLVKSPEMQALGEEPEAEANALPEQNRIEQSSPSTGLPVREATPSSSSSTETQTVTPAKPLSSNDQADTINEPATEVAERYRISCRVIRREVIPFGKKLRIGVNIEGFEAKALRFSLNNSTILKPVHQQGNYLFFELRSSENNQQLRIEDAVSNTSHVQEISGSSNSLVTLRKLDL